MYIYRASFSPGHFAFLISDGGKDIVFQYQKDKTPQYGFVHTGIYFGFLPFSTLARRSRFIRFFFFFSCIGFTLSKSNCSNETSVGVDSIGSRFQLFVFPRYLYFHNCWSLILIGICRSRRLADRYRSGFCNVTKIRGKTYFFDKGNILM